MQRSRWKAQRALVMRIVVYGGCVAVWSKKYLNLTRCYYVNFQDVRDKNMEVDEAKESCSTQSASKYNVRTYMHEG